MKTIMVVCLLTASMAHAESILVKPGGVSAMAEGATVVRTFDAAGFEQWDVPGSGLEAIEHLRSRGVYAELDAIVSIAATPNDSLYQSKLWNMNNTGQSGGCDDCDIDAPEAWDIFTGDSTLIVAVLDTGIQLDHPDLTPNLWTNPDETLNGIDDDGNGYVDDLHGWDWGTLTGEDNDPSDDHGHGTHVSGIIGAVGDNSIGVAGINWRIKIMPLKFLNVGGNGSTSDAIAAMEYARLKGVKIINNSWGGTNPSVALANEIAVCTAAGMLNVCASGNNGTDIDCCPTLCGFFPAGFPDPGVISVGNSNSLDGAASSSNYGLDGVDLFAPGTAIWSTATSAWSGPVGYINATGTSMASPHVAGAVALVWGLEPSLSAASVKARILGAVEPKPAFNGLCVTGGRLNLHNAITSTSSVGPQRAEPVLEGAYDIQGRKVGPTRSGITFQRKGKRVTVR